VIPLIDGSGRIRATVSNGDDYRQSELLHGSVEILPAGVQNLYEIIGNIERAGLGEKIVRRVLL
jgi:hypothetical protein